MILQPIIDWIVANDAFFDWFNFGNIIVNLIFAGYVRTISSIYYKKYKVEVLPIKSRGLLDGIFIIEGLFLAALWSWMGGTTDIATQNIAIATGTTIAEVDPSLLYYIIAENGKSIYFFSVNFLVWREVMASIHAVDKSRKIAQQNLAALVEVKK